MFTTSRLAYFILTSFIALLMTNTLGWSEDRNAEKDSNIQILHNISIKNKIDKAFFVLIPGWGGSTIYTCPEESSPLEKCVNIYGNKSSYQKLYDLSIRPGAIYKHDVIKPETGSFSLYKDFSSYIEKNAAGKIDVSASNANYLELSYDWRASIKDSASYMANIICNKTDEDSDFEFFFIGHSMGGLVLKEWLFKYKDLPCAGGHAPNVRAVAFVGTPHFGSMVTVKNLLEGILLFKPYQYQAWFEKVSPTLEQSAPWNPSSYELLPLFGSENCLERFKAITENKYQQIKPRIYVTTGSASEREYPDLHSDSTWKALKLFRGYQAKQYPYPSYSAIREWLRDASKVMCDLAQFNPASKIPDKSSHFYPITYIAGARPENTSAGVDFNAKKDMEFSFELEAGDETVTYDSASNFPTANPREVKVVDKDNYKHLDLLRSDAVTNLLTSWLEEISFGLKSRENGNITRTTPPLSPQNYNPRPRGKKIQMLKAGSVEEKRAGLIPLPPDPKLWRNADVKETITENIQRLKTYGITPEAFVQSARTPKPSQLEVSALVSASALFETDSILQLDLLVKAASMAAKIQNTKVLINLAKYVADKLVQKDLVEKKSELGKLKSDLLALRQLIYLKGEMGLVELIDRATKFDGSTKSESGVMAEFEHGHDQTITTINDNVVTIVSGSPYQNSLYMIYEIASALEDRSAPRVIPLVSKGTAQSVNDLLYLNRVDMAVLRSDIIEYYRRLGLPAQKIEDRLRYITKTGLEPMRVVTNNSVNSIYELSGKKVNFGYTGTDSQISTRMVFDDLGINVQEVNSSLFDGVQSVLKGDIAATVIFEGNTKEKLIAQTRGVDKLKFLPVPMNEKLAKSYQPYRIKLDQYPEFVSNLGGVDTIAVYSVIASYAWPRGNARYERVASFTKALFNNVGRFGEQSGNSSWRDIELTTGVPGWKRFDAAQDHLDRIFGIFKSSGNDPQIKSQVERFLLEARPRADDQSPDGEALLYRQFLEWRQTSCSVRGSC